MTFDGDELAGMVDPFGVLTRVELRRAITEVLFRRGEDADDETVASDIDRAVQAYQIVVCPPEAVEDVAVAGGGDESPELLAVGPTAFPETPEGAEDLVHILDAGRRRVDRALLGRAVVERLRGQAARAVDRGDEKRVQQLMDVSYDVEAWAPVDVSDVRQRFDSSLSD